MENLSSKDASNKNSVTPPLKPPRIESAKPQDEWESKLFGKQANKREYLRFVMSL